MKDTYNVFKVWEIIKPKLLTGFPPDRSKVLCYIYIYGKFFVDKESYSKYLLEAYDLFRDIILVDGFLSVLEFATIVAGCGSDELMQNLNDWAHDDSIRFTHVPCDLTETVYDFDYMWSLITEALAKICPTEGSVVIAQAAIESCI